MTFDDILAQVLDLLQREKRISYRALKRRFALDDDYLEDVKDEFIYAKKLAVDEENRVLVWAGEQASTAAPSPAPGMPALATSPLTEQERDPLSYTPQHLAEKILTSRSALEGERKQVTVLFADLKGSMELLADRDPEEARQLLDPVLERMMAAVHRYEGTVNQVMGDGIMALFGAPLAHEDHAVRACYAALAMQATVQQYAAEVQRTQRVPLQMRVGVHAGEVVVRTISNDLHMDYSAVGQTTHLAARMEQMAMPGSILITLAVLRLTEGYLQIKPLGPVPVKGLRDPVEVFELVGASGIWRRLQATVARGLTRFVGRQSEFETLRQVLEQAGAGYGQVVAVVGEAGVGKSRLVYEFIHSHHTPGWLVLERALSQTTENRKVEAPKPLIFRDSAFGFDLQNPTLRQSPRVSWTPVVAASCRRHVCRSTCGDTVTWSSSGRISRGNTRRRQHGHSIGCTPGVSLDPRPLSSDDTGRRAHCLLYPPHSGRLRWAHGTPGDPLPAFWGTAD
jgi:class 3 adenylate cyclase